MEYLVRTARITDIDRLVALSDAGIRSSDAAGALARRICSDSWSISRRRASSSPSFGARWSVGRSSPFGRQFAPADSWGQSTFSWWIPTTMWNASPMPSSKRSFVRHATRAAVSSKRRCRTTRRRGPAGNVTGLPKVVRVRNGRWPRSGPPRAGPNDPARRAASPRRRRGQGITKESFVGKNVAVFVDVANIFYAAKAAGVDIDYVTLLKSATAGRDFVRAYAYTGLDPDNENQRNFHSFLARNQLQGRQQGHSQVRRRQGQGESRHRARRRPDEDGPQPRRGHRRVRATATSRRRSGRSRRWASASRSSASAATPRRT